MKRATIPIHKEELDEFIKRVEVYIATHYNHISLNSVLLVDGSAGVLLFYACLQEKMLTYWNGMKASGEVITEDLRLSERIFYLLRKMTNN